MEEPRQPSRQDVSTTSLFCSTLHSDWVWSSLDATGPLCEHEFANSAMLVCLLVSPEARKLREMKLSTYFQADTKNKLHMKIVVLLGDLPEGTV